MSGDPTVFLEWATRVGGPVAGAMGLGWWLSGRFRNLEIAANTRFRELEKAGQDRLEKIVEAFRVSISSHEALDQMRHEQNLAKFTDISVTLARAGLNGRPKAGTAAEK